MNRTLLPGLLFCVSAAFAQMPQWYTTHTLRAYQPEFYIIGVGAADGANAVEKAQKNAQADIVSQIKVQVKSEIRSITESYQLNQDETISSDFRSQSRTMVNEEITGAVIVETFVDPSTQTAYAFAALERERYCEALRSDMNSAWTQASDLRSSADDFLKRGKFSDAVHAVADARALVIAALPKKALHDAVAHGAYTPPNASSPVSFTGDMKTMVSKVRIEKLRGDKQTGKVGSRFDDPFVVRVLYQSTPVSGQALRFETMDDLLLGEAATDGNGEASFTTHVRMLPGNTVRVKMSLGELSKELDRSLLSSAAIFSYTPRPSDIGFELAAPSLKGQMAETMKGKVASALSKIGYGVLPVSRYRLALSLQNTPASKSEGFSGTLYTVKVEAVVALIDKESGAAIGQYSATASGGGRTEQEAVTKAAAGLSLDRMKLAELLEKTQR